MGPCTRTPCPLSRVPRDVTCAASTHPIPTPLHTSHGPWLQVVVVGVPTKPWTVAPMDVIWGRKSLSGSLIGGVAETQEMLDFCGKVLRHPTPLTSYEPPALPAPAQLTFPYVPILPRLAVVSTTSCATLSWSRPTAAPSPPPGSAP
jgi:hypothetical protein